MQDELTLAIAKGIKSAIVKKASNNIGIGDHNVDTLIRVKGYIRKGEDNECAPTVSLSMLETMALTLHYAGITREAAMSAIRKAATEALENDSKTKGALLDKYDWIGKEIDTIKKDIISKLPPIVKSGTVTTKVTFEEVALGTEAEKELAETEAETEAVAA